jgi:hypothetical protein
MGPELVAIAALASAGVSAVGALVQGGQAKAMADYNAKVAENDARAAELQAGYEEERFRDRAGKLRSAQRAAVAKSGIDLEGSPLAVMEETALEAEMDALSIRQQGSVEAARARSRAALDRMEGKAAKTASYFRAASSLLNGASAYGQIYGAGAR